MGNCACCTATAGGSGLSRWWVVGEIAASLATDAPFCRRGREHAAARRADGSGPAVTDECSHRGVGITMPVRIAAVKTRASAGVADPAGPLAIIGAMTVASATHRASGPLAANRGFELPLRAPPAASPPDAVHPVMSPG